MVSAVIHPMGCHSNSMTLKSGEQLIITKQHPPTTTCKTITWRRRNSKRFPCRVLALLGGSLCNSTLLQYVRTNKLTQANAVAESFLNLRDRKYCNLAGTRRTGVTSIYISLFPPPADHSLNEPPPDFKYAA
jgi:hypothetical protein